MVFLINRFGAVTTQIQPPLSQGTVGVETMTIFAPFPSSVVCTVSAQLPNGAYIEPIPVENTTVAGLFKDGQPLSMWIWKPDARITQYAGIVRVQFAFTSGDQRLTTSDVTFRIDGGVPHITPEVDEGDYDTILQVLALANLAKNNAYDAMYRAMAWAIGKTVGDISTVWVETQGDAQIPINKWQYIGKIGIDRAEQVTFIHDNSGWRVESGTSVIAIGVNLSDYGIDYLGTASFIVNVQIGDVAGTDPAYHNNAKYYAEQASESATEVVDAKNEAVRAKNSAAASAGRAETSATTATNAATAAGEYKSAAESAADRAEEAVRNLSVIGRYLSNWNSDTGRAMSNPQESPYEYKRGDYFIVGYVTPNVTHYRPKGTEYDATDPESEVETAEVKLNDVYFYDGTNWLLQVNAPRDTSFASITGSPADNASLNAYFVKASDVSTLVSANKVARRDGNGNLKTGTPHQSADAVNLDYFEAHSSKTELAPRYIYWEELVERDDPSESAVTINAGENLTLKIRARQDYRQYAIGRSVDIGLVARTSPDEPYSSEYTLRCNLTIGALDTESILFHGVAGPNSHAVLLSIPIPDSVEITQGTEIEVFIGVDASTYELMFVSEGANGENSTVSINGGGYVSKLITDATILYGHDSCPMDGGGNKPGGHDVSVPLNNNGDRIPGAAYRCDEDGRFKVPNAINTSGKEAVNLDTMNAIAFTVQDRPASSNDDEVLAITPTGTKTSFTISSNEKPNGIAQRDGDGQIAVPLVPTSAEHAASKDYVDNAIGGITIIASTNKTVNGYSVPVLTDQQLLAIYNATTAGKSVSITDATENVHFSGVTADIVEGEVFVSFLYFDKMILEYGEGNVTNFTVIGGGSSHETWTFTLDDGTTVTKEVVLWSSQG